MNSNSVTRDGSDERVLQLAAEQAALDYIEMRDRILDLESDNRAYQELAKAAIEALHVVTRERDQARRSLRILRRSLPDSESERRRAA